MEYQETWFRSRTIAQESEEKAVIFSFNALLRTSSVGRYANNSTSFNRRQGIEEALKQVDGSSETVVNTLREYVVMNSTLKSILRQVSLGLWLRLIGIGFFAF